MGSVSTTGKVTDGSGNYVLSQRQILGTTFPKTLPLFVLILIYLQRWQHRAHNGTKHLPHTMLQKLLDLLKLKSLKFCLKIHLNVICHIRCQVNIDYHNQHESAVLIGLFHVTSSVLPSLESYPNYRKPTQRGVQGYLSSLQRRVVIM